MFTARRATNEKNVSRTEEEKNKETEDTDRQISVVKEFISSVTQPLQAFDSPKSEFSVPVASKQNNRTANFEIRQPTETAEH